MNLYVEPIPTKEAKPWILRRHYAHRMPSIVHAHGFFLGRTIVGCCTYGIPPQKNLMLLCGDSYVDNVLELNRVIKEDGLPKNTQSYCLAQSFSLLPRPMIIVSYADPNQGHTGFTYQALNFLYTGTGGATKEYRFQGKEHTMRHMKDHWFSARKIPFDASLSIDENFLVCGGEIIRKELKHRYVLFLGNRKQKRHMSSCLRYKIYDYPKNDNRRYDTSAEIIKQPLLFAEEVSR